MSKLDFLHQQFFPAKSENVIKEQIKIDKVKPKRKV